jgi:DtxR family Mn-dependent transcriptional regulator
MVEQEIQDVEEALGIIYNLREKKTVDLVTVTNILTRGVNEKIVQTLQEKNYIRLNHDYVELTPEGEKIAVSITRRHRLAERLLADVLSVTPEKIDSSACLMEHFLSPEVTEAVCTLLGHPRLCPHGAKIPPGPCCQKKTTTIPSVVITLAEMTVGQKARVLYLAGLQHSDIHKLLSLGIIPGEEIVLHQNSPAFIVKSGETQIALDKEIAGKIYVRPAR